MLASFKAILSLINILVRGASKLAAPSVIFDLDLTGPNKRLAFFWGYTLSRGMFDRERGRGTGSKADGEGHDEDSGADQDQTRRHQLRIDGATQSSARNSLRLRGENNCWSSLSEKTRTGIEKNSSRAGF